MAEADLNQILVYIKEREETLTKYSDKLRQSLVKIANVFGRKDLCRLCRCYVDRHPIRKIGTDEILCEKPIPGIEVSIDVTDDEPFYTLPATDTSPEIKYYLAIRNHNLGWVDITYSGENPRNVCDFAHDASRELLKALVKSGRLIPFLQKVADELASKNQEYREVAEVAEKLAKAVR
jgi:hypothetical protein